MKIQKAFTGETTASLIHGPGKTGYPGEIGGCDQSTFHTYVVNSQRIDKKKIPSAMFTCKRRKLDVYLLQRTKPNPKWIKNPNLRHQAENSRWEDTLSG